MCSWTIAPHFSQNCSTVPQFLKFFKGSSWGKASWKIISYPYSISRFFGQPMKIIHEAAQDLRYDRTLIHKTHRITEGVNSKWHKLEHTNILGNQRDEKELHKLQITTKYSIMVYVYMQVSLILFTWEKGNIMGFVLPILLSFDSLYSSFLTSSFFFLWTSETSKIL